MFDAELSGLGVCGVEDIEAVSFDGAASVEDGDDAAAGVVIEGEERAEGEEPCIGGDELHGVGPDGLVGGGDAVGVYAAGLLVGGVCGDGHPDAACGLDGPAVEVADL